eukprot:scaffold452925_cov47-Attheya_sp.AAC.1
MVERSSKGSEEVVQMEVAASTEAAEDYGDGHDLASDDMLVERVFQDLLDDISIEVACGMHRMAKMGDISYVSIMFPPVQHPLSLMREPITDTEINHDTGSIDTNTNHDTEDGDTSHVDLLVSGSVPKKARLNATTVQEMEEPEATTITATTATTRSAVTDIWGRIPPKEPRRTATCTLCGRHLS